MFELIIAAVILMFLAFAMFGIRMIFVKRGEFRGTCAGNSPYLKKDGIACGVCGAMPGETCAKEENKEVISRNQA